MIEKLLQLARPEIRALKAYSSARRENSSQGVFLNANENPYAKAHADNIHRYPEPQPEQLRAGLATLYGVAPRQCLMTRGCDEGIDLLLRTFCQAGVDAIITCTPTYDMYQVSAAIQNAQVISVPLQAQTFALDIPAVLAAWQPQCKLVFLCSPNNPTGNCFSPTDIMQLCASLQDKALVIVDEAYIEFAEQASMTQLLSTQANLVVLRTLSKAYGLAGARCGAVLAHAQIIALLEKVISPYPIPSPVIQLVARELQADNQTVVQAQLTAIKAQRAQLQTFLQTLPYVQKVWASEANFILVKVDDPQALMALCEAHHIIIRDRSSKPELAGCVRISVGTPEENEKLKQVLTQYKQR